MNLLNPEQSDQRTFTKYISEVTERAIKGQRTRCDFFIVETHRASFFDENRRFGLRHR